MLALPILLSFLTIQVSVSAGDVFDGSKKLMMVQAFWRHGDRTPTETYRNDKFTEDYWNFGGGGWGELTPTGMRQNMELGQKLRARYIEGTPYKFLSPRFNKKEVYVRSTDRNRTLLAATSAMIGMYGGVGQNGESYSKAGIDHPAVRGWPVGYVPIPIHTIEGHSDHLLISNIKCALQDTIWKLAKQTPVVAEFLNSSEFVELMQNLTEYAGQEINVENLWILYTALRIEKLYYPEIFQNMTPWYTDELFAKIDDVNAQAQDFYTGIGLDGVMSNNLDIGKTIKKIRSGTLINDIVDRMKRKIECQGNSGKECDYTNRRNFFAYSGHDTGMYSLLALLNIANTVVQPRGYPLYSACIILEQWQDVNTKQNFFKMLYYRNENDTLDNVITSAIPGCSGGDYCELEVLQIYANLYKPDMEMDKWCDYDILKQSAPALTSAPSSAPTATWAM